MVVLVAHVTDTHDALTAWEHGSTFGVVWPTCSSMQPSPADPFAGVEHRHDRHLVDRRCLAVWMSITFWEVVERSSYRMRISENSPSTHLGA